VRLREERKSVDELQVLLSEIFLFRITDLSFWNFAQSCNFFPKQKLPAKGPATDAKDKSFSQLNYQFRIQNIHSLIVAGKGHFAFIVL